MVRQRGRGGGLLKPRSRRGVHRSRVTATEQSGTNDTKSDTLPSGTASEGAVPPQMQNDATRNPQLPSGITFHLILIIYTTHYYFISNNLTLAIELWNSSLLCISI